MSIAAHEMCALYTLPGFDNLDRIDVLKSCAHETNNDMIMIITMIMLMLTLIRILTTTTAIMIKLINPGPGAGLPLRYGDRGAGKAPGRGASHGLRRRRVREDAAHREAAASSNMILW